MPELVRITVEFDLNRTNPNRMVSLHWSEKMRRKNLAIMMGRLAWRAAGCPKLTGVVRVEVTVRRARTMDAGNVWAAAKPLIDALFCGNRFAQDGGAITLDDSPRYLRLGDVHFETSKQWKGREEVVFAVEEIE